MAIGDIGAAVQDTLTFDIDGSTPSICRVLGSVYAVAYTGQLGDGWIKTFSIDANGDFSAVVDSEEFDETDGSTPTIIRAHPGIFAVAYRGVDGDGFCKTYAIDTLGNITDVPKDTLEFETDSCYGRAQNFLKVYGNIFAYAYQGTGGFAGVNAVVKTFDIDPVGNIGSVVGTLTIAVGQNMGLDFIHCTGTVYALAHQSLVEDTKLHTFTISNAGAISAVIATTSLDTTAGSGSKLKLVHISGNVCAIGYQDSASAGVLETRTISAAGAISAVISTSAIVETPYSMLYIPGGACGYAYASGDICYVRTIPVSDAGVIGTETDYLGIMSANSYFPHLMHHREDIYVCVLTGPPTSDGLAKTFTATNTAPLPTEGQTRVTSIIHRYDRGVYNMELGLGDVTADFNIPSVSTDTRKSYERDSIRKRIDLQIEEERRLAGQEAEAYRRTYPGLQMPGGFPQPDISGSQLQEPYDPSLWERITPWLEQEGETFPSEVMERVRAVQRWFRGLF